MHSEHDVSARGNDAWVDYKVGRPSGDCPAWLSSLSLEARRQRWREALDMWRTMGGTFPPPSSVGPWSVFEPWMFCLTLHRSLGLSAMTTAGQAGHACEEFDLHSVSNIRRCRANHYRTCRRTDVLHSDCPTGHRHTPVPRRAPPFGGATPRPPWVPAHSTTYHPYRMHPCWLPHSHLI